MSSPPTNMLARHGVIYAHVWQSDRFRLLTPAQRCVYVSLAIYAHRVTRRCFPKQKTLAYDTGLSERAVERAIQRLRDLGFIEVERRRAGRKRINEYTLVLKPLPPPPPPIPPLEEHVAGGQIRDLNPAG